MAIEEIVELNSTSDVRGIDAMNDSLLEYTNVLGIVDDKSGDAEKSSNKFSGAFSSLATSIASGLIIFQGLSAAVGLAGAAFDQVGAITSWSDAMNDVEATTGLVGDALIDFRSQAQDVFTGNFGDSITDVTTVMGQAQKITKANGDELQSWTENAITLRDVFDKDINESLRAADTLTEAFGIDGAKAFDLLTFGLQQTGDVGDDLLDTFNEYSNNFAALGLSADQALRLMMSGLEGGARNTDDIADATREFGIRFLEDQDAFQAALRKTGQIDEGFFEDLEAGAIDGADALQTTLNALRGMEDPIARNALGVQLFGTKFEDMGVEAFLAMSIAGGELEEMAGATDRAADAANRGLGNAWEGLKRTAITTLTNALEPLLLRGLEPLIFVMTILAGFIPRVSQVIGDKGLAGGLLSLTNVSAFGSGIMVAFFKQLGFGQEMAVKMSRGLNSLVQAIIEFSSAAMVAGADLWAILLPALEKMADAILPVVHAGLGFLVDSIITLVNMLPNLSTESLVILGAALAILVGPAIIAGIIALTGAFLAMVGTMVIAAAPFAIIAALVLAAQTNFGGFGDAVSQVVDGIQNKDAAGVLMGIANSLIAIPIGIADEILNILGVDWSVSEGMQAWADIFSTSWDLLTDIPGAISDIIESTTGIDIPAGLSAYEGIWDNIKTIGSKLPGIISDFVSELALIVVPAGLSTIKDLVKTIETKFADAPGKIAEFVSSITGIPQAEVLQWIEDRIAVVSDTLDDVPGAFDDFVAAMEGITIPDAMQSVGDLFSTLWQAVAGLPSAVETFVGSMLRIIAPELFTTLVDLWSSIYENVNALIGSEGISAFITKIGEVIVPQLLTDMADTVFSIYDGFSQAVGWVESFITGIGLLEVPEPLRTIAELVGQIASAPSWVVDQVKSLVPKFQMGTPWTGSGSPSAVAGVVHQREAVIPAHGMRVFPSPGGLQLQGGTATGPSVIHNVINLDGRVLYEAWDEQNKRRV